LAPNNEPGSQLERNRRRSNLTDTKMVDQYTTMGSKKLGAVMLEDNNNITSGLFARLFIG
jgi:hypothetical protein